MQWLLVCYFDSVIVDYCINMWFGIYDIYGVGYMDGKCGYMKNCDPYRILIVFLYGGRKMTISSVLLSKDDGTSSIPMNIVSCCSSFSLLVVSIMIHVGTRLGYIVCRRTLLKVSII